MAEQPGFGGRLNARSNGLRDCIYSRSIDNQGAARRLYTSLNVVPRQGSLSLQYWISRPISGISLSTGSCDVLRRQDWI